MTTIHSRSFFGPGLTQFASTFVVCAALLLIAAAVASDHDLSTSSDTSACTDSSDRSRDHAWTDDHDINEPDSCDDEDGDEDAPDDSSQALSERHRRPAHLDDAFHIVRVEVDAPMFRPSDAHSLRGPPLGQKESSDGNIDDDDDDDGVGAHHSAPRAAADRKPQSLSSLDRFHPASTVSSQALRAPPCSSPR